MGPTLSRHLEYTEFVHRPIKSRRDTKFLSTARTRRYVVEIAKNPAFALPRHADSFEIPIVKPLVVGKLHPMPAANTVTDSTLFKSAAAFEAWLRKHHARSEGLWLKLAKKGAADPSVTYAEAVDIALCWGWIDGQKKAWRVEVAPFKDDPQKDRMNGLETLTYVFRVAPDLPGAVYEIDISARDPAGAVLLEEKLRYDGKKS